MSNKSTDQYMNEIAEALSRIEYSYQKLHERENLWEHDPDDGMFLFKGEMDPFIVKKHIVDLLREVWHLGDGIRELINAKWRDGKINAVDTDLDSGRGPGKCVVNNHLKRCQNIQLCGDLANLTKHYVLTRATKTGKGPPVIGDSCLVGTTSGKMELSNAQSTGRIMRFERPFSFRPTLVVLDEDGNQLGDAVDIAIKARDSWLQLLQQCGFTFSKKNTPPES